MDDFYKHIKHKLDNGPAHTPDEDVWAAVAGGIVSKKSWIPFPLWYLLPFGVLLLLAVGGGYYWGNSQARLQPAKAQANEQKAIPPKQRQALSPEIIHDTLLLRDTLVQFVYLPAKSSQSSPSSSVQIPSLAISPSADSVLFFIHDKLYLKTKQGIAQISEDPNPDALDPSVASDDQEEIALPELAEIKFREAIDDLFPSRIPRYPRPFIPGYGEPNPFREALRVDEKRIGLGFQGLNVPFTLNFEEEREWSTSLEGELVFTEKVSLISGLQYRFDQIKSEDLAFVTTFPQPSNVDPEATFKEMYMRVSYLEVPLLAKYSFPSRSSFSPFMMAGPMISKAIRQNLEFEYEDLNNEEYKLQVPLEAGSIHLSSWIISGGVAYKLGPDSPFSIFAEGRFRYNSNISAEEYSKIHGLGLRVGGTWSW